MHLPLFMRNVSQFLYLMIQLHHHHHLYTPQPPSSTTYNNNNNNYIYAHKKKKHKFLLKKTKHCLITCQYACMMDSLLCNELCPLYNEVDEENNDISGHVFSTKEDCEEALLHSLAKEANYMPEKGYLEFVKTNHIILDARFKAVNWLVKSQRRMNLSPGTVFLGVNYMDRFISLTRCQDWDFWMFELLCVACLTIATKFNETTNWTLHEFQVEGVDNCFAPALIQRMELRVLKALAWRMDSTTPFSYIHIFTQNVNDALNKTLVHDSTNRVTQLLLCALLDPEFLEFRQCVVSMSAVRCVFEASTSNGSSLDDDTRIPNDQKDNLVKCERMMGQLLVHENDYWHVPPSPVTVLKVEWFNFYNDYTSFLQTPKIKSGKRKREELECGM